MENHSINDENIEMMWLSAMIIKSFLFLIIHIDDIINGGV